MLDHIISRAWLHFNPTTLCQEGEKPSEYCNFFAFCQRRESNQGRQLSKRVRYPLHHCPSALDPQDTMRQLQSNCFHICFYLREVFADAHNGATSFHRKSIRRLSELIDTVVGLTHSRLIG